MIDIRIREKEAMMGIRSSEAVSANVTGLPAFATPLVTWMQRFFRDGFAGLSKSGCVRRLKLVETLQLGGKRQLMLILCDGQLLLVGAGADSIQSIIEMRRPSLNPPTAATSEGVPPSGPAGAMECSRQEAV